MPMILRELFVWAFSLRRMLAAGLSFAVVFSAVGVAYSAHQTRNMYRDLQHLEKELDDLEHGYERLLLEQSAQADYTRLNRLASKELAMRVPTPEDTVVVE